MWCTSGFVDDVMFSHLWGTYVVYGEAYGRGMSVSGRQREEGRSFSASVHSPCLRCLSMTDIPRPLASPYTTEFGCGVEVCGNDFLVPIPFPLPSIHSHSHSHPFPFQHCIPIPIYFHHLYSHSHPFPFPFRAVTIYRLP